MADGRRHSVDIPIAKTLVALRRVRSLRDPSTNSMSKFSALVDNMNWETNSSNGISLRFLNGSPEVGSDNNCILGAGILGFNGQTEEHKNDNDYYKKTRKGLVENASSNHIEDKQIEGSDYCGSNRLGVYGQESLSERYCSDYRDKELDLTFVPASANRLDDVDLSNERIIGLSSQAENMDHTSLKQKNRYKNRIKSPREVAHIASSVGSPCMSVGDGLFGGSNRSTSSFASENFDVVDREHRGCGVSCCWSRTPRFRDSNFRSDEEDDPLLSGEVSEKVLFNQRRSPRPGRNEIVPYVETSRSLSQKFRPKSFNDLVGHNVVARSLLSAISKGRIASFYIFHGPRGTGKTSASRIFAAALNCLSLEEHKPCGMCRECILFFDGKSRDVKEVDSVRINRRNRVRSFVRSASIPPVSSRFKVFIVDECQLLGEETWATILNCFDDLSQNIVFVMITADLDKLPRSAVSRSQKYHFPKIKESDIASRLEKISIEEGLDFDPVALEFVAAKSNGSVRDAEMMLDQLSLLGKRITMSLSCELIGIVPDDELLDLLDLALSSDTSNTVKRARDMMKSRIDPMQLISQLANLIMDILAGKCQERNSQVRKDFFRRHTSEADMQRLSHALKILSETEKQLRRSKNQMTWLTVALLQLSSSESTFCDPNDSRVPLRMPHQRDGDFCSTSSTAESLKYLVTCDCDVNKSHQPGMHDCEGKLEATWKKTTELCQSHSLRNFLRNEGRLSSVCVSQGLAVAELDFHHPSHVARAERSWKLIASLLQSILRCNVEIRINLVPRASTKKKLKVKRACFNFFSCSRNFNHTPQSTSELGSGPSEHSDLTSEKAMMTDKQNENCSSERGPRMSQICYHSMEPATTIRSNEGNALSTGRIMPYKPSQENIPKGPEVENKISNPDGNDSGREVISIQEPESQPKCFCGIVRLHRKLQSSFTSQMIYLRNQPQKKHASSIPSKKSFEAYFCGNGICCSASNICNNSFRDGDIQRKESKVHCWQAPSSLKKAWQLRHHKKKPHSMGCDLPCASAK